MSTSGSQEEKVPSQLIDEWIKELGDWQGKTLIRLRKLIKQVDPEVVEEVKWKRPANPMGVPVWSHDGIICIGDALKNAVRLTFPKGAQLKDPKKLFNARLESKTFRAIDFHEGDSIDDEALKTLIQGTIALNISKTRGQSKESNS